MNAPDLSQLAEQLAGLDAEPRQAFETWFDPADSVELRGLFAIEDCGEDLVEIAVADFPRVSSHAYDSLGAPYGGASPFHLRSGVLSSLHQAMEELQRLRPGWQIEIFDAYRPLAVQAFMVNYEFDRLAREQGYLPEQLSDKQAAPLWHQVFSIWARPLDDPQMPPPHTTGAALDITLLDEHGVPVPMGSAIDAIGRLALPHCFADSTSQTDQLFNSNRQLLAEVMAAAGFQRHPFEWWHYSRGDQLWALMEWLDTGHANMCRYGKAPINAR